VLHTWEIAALIAIVATLVARRRRGPVSNLIPDTPRWNWALGIGCLLAAAIPLGSAWSYLAPNLAPSGADYEGYYLSALAIETGDFSLYVRDRYPGFPWLASVFASSPRTIHEAGARINMLAMVGSVLALYTIGRHLGGRAVGVVGALIAARISLVMDLGHTFTHYPLTAALDAVLLALVLSLATREKGMLLAWAAGFTGALAGACDPKQFAFVGMAFGVAAACLVLRKTWSIKQRGLGLLGLVAPLIATNIAVGQLPVKLFSLEEVATRVQLHFKADPQLAAQAEQGFRLGEPGALLQLPVSIVRVATSVAPETHQKGLIAPLSLEAMPVVWGPVSPLWTLLILGLLGTLAWKRPKVWGAKMAVVAIPLAIAWPNFHMHYQNRYFLAAALLAPVLVAAGLQALAGTRAVLAAGIMAIGWPTSPFFEAGTSYLERKEHRHDIWVGREHGVDLENLRWAIDALPEDTMVFDFSERRPAPSLAAAHPYVRCNMEGDQCVSKIVNHPGTRVAVLWSGEFLSSRVPGGTGAIPASAAQGGGTPDQVGECWRRVRWLNPDAGVFRYECKQPPRPLPHLPPPPPPDDW